MASNAAVPFWRSAGMTYITYSNLCANLVRNCLKEPYKSEATDREKVHFSISKWVDGKPQKPTPEDGASHVATSVQENSLQNLSWSLQPRVLPFPRMSEPYPAV